MPAFEITAIDLAFVAVYITLIIWLGFYFARRTRTTDDYFLAGRSLTWGLIGASLFASNISSSSIIGMAGEAYGTGIAVYNYEWMAVVILIIFAVFLVPFYLQSRVYTMPEFLERRFDTRSRYYFSGITIVGNILIDTAGALYAGSLVVQMIYPGIPMWISVVLLAILAGLYTVAGGLSAVVYTDAIQAVLLFVGAAIVAIVAFGEIGSWDAVTTATPPEMLSLIRPADDDVLPWPGLVTGVLLLGFYFWTTNQFMVQRVLGARDLNHARWGLLFAGLLKVPVIFIMVLPGTFARVLYPGLARADLVFPTMMFDLLPVGIRGVVITALVAAIMSSVDSTLNSASTLVTMDFVKKLKPKADQRTLVVTGRVVTFAFMVLAAAWAPQILKFPSLWQYLQQVLAYLSPPIVSCFVVGLFWSGATRRSAFWGLTIGHVASAALFVAQPDIHFLYIPPILFGISTLTIAVVSLIKPEPADSGIRKLTWSRRTFRAETRSLSTVPAYKNYRFQAAVLLALTAVFVVMFR